MPKSSSTYQIRAEAGLGWLLRSIDATGGKGSSHIFARWRYPLSGWHLGYPETTGYIIETLLDYTSDFPNLPLKAYAETSSRWLLSQQLEEGAFPSLLAGSRIPSIFNSGMIVFGLLDAEKRIGTIDVKPSMNRLRLWLHTQLNDRTSTSEPTYLTRALWAFYLLAMQYDDITLKQKVKQIANECYLQKNSQNGMPHWGFNRSQKAFTHTIAYTLRGFFELGLLLQESKYLQFTQAALERLERDRIQRGRLAGSYDDGWRGNYSFRCVTGHAQISIICLRLYQETGDSRWLMFGRMLFEDIQEDQILNTFDAQLTGAVPGSKPIWGPYMRGKYPNWSVKFYLDALRLYNQLP